ncbi:GABA permease GabA [Aspergillus fumigatus A1163]|uniref:GABA permease GabA n=1 Tax=Aspergillus fumigatus (strain CBS 144.89 / FGSC A1163 / CEA10) TaxID=451804 RepID=B0YAE9_ASPFC|nr:GABA permease GabA [Aspergillus fumigatus A1163]
MSSESGSSSGAQLAKNFSRISLLGLAFITLNSWTAFSSALPLSLTSGGPTSIIWGLLTAGVCTLCIAASLAEFLSAYPTAAGRYRWVAGNDLCSMNVLLTEAPVSWDDYERVLSWFTAWANVAAWICLCATASLFGSQLVTNTVILVHPDFNFLRWHVFLIYVGFNLIAFLVNAFWNSILSALNRAALIWSLCGFSIIFVTVLACASPNYNSARHVAVGANEPLCSRVSSIRLDLIVGDQGPMAWLGSWGTLPLLFTLKTDPQPSAAPRWTMPCRSSKKLWPSELDILTNRLGPGRSCTHDRGNSHANRGWTAHHGRMRGNWPRHQLDLYCCPPTPLSPLVLGLSFKFFLMQPTVKLGRFACYCTDKSPESAYQQLLRVKSCTNCSCRDSGLPFSPIWTTVHARLKTPVNALVLNAAAVFCCGCIFLGSSSAFNALSAAAVICFDISYCLPILIHCLRGRKLLPARPWILHPAIGWIVNLVSIAYISFTTVLFMFPPARPVTGSTMNYAIAATGVFALLSAIYWFVRGRKHFMQVLVTAEMAIPEARPSSCPIKSDV